MIDWCLTCQFEDYDGSEEPCINCVSDTEVEGNAKPTEYFPKRPPKPITNADRIRAMTDEELAGMFTDIGVRTLRLHRLPVAEPVIEQAKEDWLYWLRMEAET